MRFIRLFLLFFAIVYLAPLGLHAAVWMSQERENDFGRVDWSSANMLPPPAANEQAGIYVFAGRIARQRGIFAHHHWLVVKERGATVYTRYDVTRWANGVRENGWAADGRWFGNTPILVGKLEGEAAEKAIPRLRAAVRRYRDAFDGYVLWPGPNSNSFINALIAEIPEANIALLPTGIGKDYRGAFLFAGATPSHTGFQLSANGILGLTLGWVEGVEINILGLVAGLDIRRPALKLPGFGRIGMDPA